MAVGDFTGDGFLDIVTANSSDNTISVLLGNGDGTFQSQQTYSVGSTPAVVAVGDFTGDGRLDIATANLGDNTISVLLREPLVVEAATIQPVATVPFSGVVAIISNANSASDTTAAIDWGDSTPPTSGTVIANPDGTLTVSGTHIYASPGTFPLTVNADEGTFHAQGVGQALVQPPLVVQANTISATANV
ncbi:MAG: VCBS repeat-containing protein, partial [Ktedonobacteraceae bacterium]|nr:VCBS repeat-containing protein [Ktedonobacteraceae bacterium]